MCDRTTSAPFLSTLSVLGNLSMGTSMLLVGPASFLSSLSPSLGLVYTSTVFSGLAYGLNMVSGFARSHRAAVEAGYDLEDSADVSGHLVWDSPMVPTPSIIAALFEGGRESPPQNDALILCHSPTSTGTIILEKNYLEITTTQVLTGSFATFYFFGMFLGPTASGLLVDALGFRVAAAVLSSVYLAAAAADAAAAAAAAAAWNKCRNRN